MKRDLGAKRGALTSVGASTALALVLAAAMPAHAQSGPDPTTAAPADEEPLWEQRDENDPRDRVYVLGRRVVTSVATVDVENTPQVVNVISEETLQEQGVNSLEMALRNVPGITTQIGEGGVMSGDQFFIRGLSAKNDIFTDGLRDFGVYTRDSFNYGSVEVFKGPSATAFGRGAAGGGINTTSKTPAADTFGSLNVAGGAADYMRVTGDWNQDLGDGMAARLAVMAHSNGVEGRDRIESERWGIAPSIGFGLDGGTSVTLAYLHQDEKKTPDYGVPTMQPTVDDFIVPSPEYGIDSSNFYGFAVDRDDAVVDTFTARLRHEVNDWLTLTSDLRYGVYQRYWQATPTTCNNACALAVTDGNPATIPLAGVGGPGPYDQDTQGIQSISTAQITAPLGGMRNELTVGLDASWQQNDRNGFAYVSRDTTKNMIDPQLGNDPVVGATPSNIRDTVAKDVSVFFSDRLWLTDQWSVTAGLRAATYEVDQEITAFNSTASCNGAPAVPAPGITCFTALSSNTEFLTPQVGVIFEPSPDMQFYASYSSSAKPSGVSVGNGDTLSATNDALDPEENTNIEAGMRIGLFGDRLQLQGAVFQTKKENAKEFDTTGTEIARSGDSQEVSGIELGLAGIITDEWSINAGFTWLDATITDSTTTYTFRGVTRSVVGNKINFTPEQAASLWTTYNFTGGLSGLEIGGGVTYQDDVFLNVQNTAIAPSYTSLDGYVSYRWDRFRISLNGYNLSDELYYSQVHGNRVTPAQGRTFIATLGVVY
jgi:catecholate siderophore receptor